MSDATGLPHLSCIAHFARWLIRYPLQVSQASSAHVGRFLDKHLPRCACPSPVRRVRYELHAALRHLITVLRQAGELSGDLVSDAIGTEPRRFDQYLQNARGLAAKTRAQRVHIVRRFLAQRSIGESVELVRSLETDCVEVSVNSCSTGVRPVKASWRARCAAVDKVSVDC